MSRRRDARTWRDVTVGNDRAGGTLATINDDEAPMNDETSDETVREANDEAIRERIRAFSLRDAIGDARDVIRAMYAAFDRHNEEFWGGTLRPVPILITSPGSARAQADAAEYSAF